MNHLVVIAGLIFVSYALLTLNTRAIASGRYLPTAISGALFLVVNFWLIQRVAEAHTLAELGAYLVGGVAGDLAGLWLGKRLAT